MILITGTTADDTLLGSDADEKLQGEAGNDWLAGGGGNDTLWGGAGIDTADYSTASGGVTVDLSATVPNSTGAAGNDQLGSIDAVIGSAFDDALTGDNPYQEHTRLVSSALDGGFANASASRPLVSADGKLIIFRSYASDIVSGDIPYTFDNQEAADDLFIRNMTTGQIVRLNADSAGNRVGILMDTPLNAGRSYVFSADGHAAYFIRVDWPTDRNLDPVYSVCRKDLITGALTTVSANAPGTDPNGAIYRNISVSADGGTLFYESKFQRGIYWDYGVFSQNLATGEKTLLTPPGANGIFGGTSYSVSTDGQWMTYVGVTSNLTGEGLSATRTDMFLKNLWTGEVRLIGHSDDHFSLSWAPVPPQISADGTKVVFVSETPNLVPDDAFGDANIFVMDVATGATVRIPAEITNFDLESNPPVFVGSTHLVAFVDWDATVSGANTGSYDLRIFDPATGQTRTILYDLASPFGSAVGGWGLSFSDDGSIVSVSLYDNNNLPRSLIRGDTNNLSEVLVFDMATPFTTAGDDRLAGGDGNDTLSGLGGLDVLEGGGGHDVLIGGADVDQLYGGEGNDTYVVLGSHDGNGLWLSSGEDRLVDSGGADLLLINGTALPSDLYIAVRGDDLVVCIGRFFGALDVVGIRVVGGLFNPIERIAFGSEAAGQTLEGQGGNETLQGGGGADLLNGGAGADTMFGGGGNDVYYVDNEGDITSEQSSGGAYDVVYASVNYSLAADIEYLRLTGTGHITGTGNASDNLIVGNTGNNSLAGGAGEDVLIGADGNDTLMGGSDADVLRGGAGSDHLDGGTGEGIYDIADYSTASAAIVVHLDNTGANTGEAAGDVLVNMEGIRGGAYADTLYASGIASDLYGEGGDDHLISGYNTPVDQYGRPLYYGLYGGDGDDFIEAGVGGDYIVGGAGKDTVSYLSAPGGIYLEVGVTDLLHPELYGYAWFDGYSSIEVFWGSEFADTIITSGEIFGFGGDDRIYGLGNDYIDGGAGADDMFGEYGNDTYVIDDVNDTILEYANSGMLDMVRTAMSYSLIDYVEQLVLTGTANVDGRGNSLGNALTGNSGNNMLSGLDGDDLLDGGAGADILVGGIGNDTFIVDDAGDVVDEGANAGTDLIRASGSFSLEGRAVENLTLTGNFAATAVGNGLNNVLNGNTSHNLLDGGGGSDTATGGLGNDTYVIDDAGDLVIEGTDAGIDLVQASLSYSLAGREIEHLTLTGSASLTATGNGLNNRLTGNSGNNILTGGLGDDTYYIQNTSDNVVEQHLQGSDLIYSTVSYSLFGRAVENLILQGAANLSATGNGLNNALTGNAGNNSLDGGAGADVLKGGLGNDTYYVDNAQDNVVEAHLEGSDIVISSVTYSLFGRAVENLTLTGTGHLTATGNSLNNTLTGNGGNNLLDGGAGNDSLAGGLGNDTYVVDAAADVLSEGANAGVDVVQSSRTWTLGANFESLVLTGAGIANGTGNALDNLMTGNAAANILTGGLGNDTYVLQNTSDQAVELAGEGTDTVETNLSRTLAANIENLILTGTSAINGTGNALNNRLTGNTTTNVLTGGLGNDTYVVQNTSDSVVELAGDGIDFVVASVSWTLSANVENITLTGTANLSATGNDLNNVLTGNAGNNILTGGLGDDIYYIQNAGDSVVEQHLQGTDTIVSGFTYSLFGRAVEILQLTGTDHINATGNSLNNSLLGNSGNNILDGGTGNDNLRGNGGADTFVFLAGSGKDTIRDFTAAQNDMIDIHAYTAGVVNAGLVTQNGAHVLITLGGGNVVTVENATTADVLSHIVW